MSRRRDAVQSSRDSVLGGVGGGSRRVVSGKASLQYRCADVRGELAAGGLRQGLMRYRSKLSLAVPVVPYVLPRLAPANSLRDAVARAASLRSNSAGESEHEARCARTPRQHRTPAGNRNRPCRIPPAASRYIVVDRPVPSSRAAGHDRCAQPVEPYERALVHGRSVAESRNLRRSALPARGRWIDSARTAVDPLTRRSTVRPWTVNDGQVRRTDGPAPVNT